MKTKLIEEIKSGDVIAIYGTTQTITVSRDSTTPLHWYLASNLLELVLPLGTLVPVADSTYALTVELTAAELDRISNIAPSNYTDPWTTGQEKISKAARVLLEANEA